MSDAQYLSVFGGFGPGSLRWPVMKRAMQGVYQRPCIVETGTSREQVLQDFSSDLKFFANVLDLRFTNLPGPMERHRHTPSPSR
jgi:hypothetical protein